MARTPGSRPSLPVDVNAQERAARVLQLRIAGLTEADIARQVGLSQSRVSRIIKSALASQRQQKSEDLRSLEVERTEALHRAVWPKALRGDVGAAGVVLKASERRSRLQGLDESEDATGARGSGMVVTVWVQAIALADAATMAAVVKEAQALALQAAQTQAPGATVEGVATHLISLHQVNGPYPVDSQVYRSMVDAIKRGESIAI